LEAEVDARGLMGRALIIAGIVVACLVAVVWVFGVGGSRDNITSKVQDEQRGRLAITAMPEGRRLAAPFSGEDADRVPSEYVAPAVVAAELSAFVDRNAENRVTPDIGSRIPRIRHSEDVAAVVLVYRLPASAGGGVCRYNT